MEEQEKERIEAIIKEYLESTSSEEGYSFNDIKNNLEIDTRDKDKIKEAKNIFKNLTKVKLNYSDNKGCTRIEKITETLKKIINENQLDFDKENNIVLLTRKNADKIEQAIKNDDNYYPFAKTIFDHLGFPAIQANSNRELFAVIREIDRDNSTNVWRYNRNSINEIVKYISNKENKFYEKLEKGEKNLPDELNKCGPGLKSLSSKVCKYLCEFAYHKDNYYINDTFVRHALLFYLKYYDAPMPTKGRKKITSSGQVDSNDFTYEELFNALDNLNKKRKERHEDGDITKSELDHILWYCYKSFNPF